MKVKTAKAFAKELRKLARHYACYDKKMARLYDAYRDAELVALDLKIIAKQEGEEA